MSPCEILQISTLKNWMSVSIFLLKIFSLLKESSVPISRVLCLLSRRLPFIYTAGYPTAPAFYPPSYLPEGDSDGQPSTDGLRELAASRRDSPTITRRLVVSYTTFSPLPNLSQAVILFSRIQPSPTAGTFTSGVSCAARTFLSHP